MVGRTCHLQRGSGRWRRDRKLPATCRACFGGSVSLSEEDGAWRKPDVSVSCLAGKGLSRQPRLVVEMLSPSTGREDRTTKPDFHCRFPSLEAVLLIWQDTRRVERHERAGKGWLVHDVIGSGVIALRELGIELTLEEIYA